MIALLQMRLVPKNNKSNLTQFLCRATKMQPDSSLSRKYCRLTCGPTRILSNRKKFFPSHKLCEFRRPTLYASQRKMWLFRFFAGSKDSTAKGRIALHSAGLFSSFNRRGRKRAKFFYKVRSISTQSIFHTQINTANSCQKQCLKKKKSHPDNCCCETQERLAHNSSNQQISPAFPRARPLKKQLRQ